MSERYKATGVVLEIHETMQITETFKKREFVLELEDGKYSQEVLFQTTGERCSSLDSIGRQAKVEVEFNLRGRKWTPNDGRDPRWFNSLDVWKLTELEPGFESGEDSASGEDDIPF